ncbi:MAG: class I SAM-dependent methyltransferase [Acidobacteriota bacterium]
MSPLTDSYSVPGSYDVVPYQGRIVRNASPDHLAMAALWSAGLRVCSRRVRVVELGCGDGRNLLALAFYDPGSGFVGIDRSEVELDRARRGAQRVGLANVDFVLEDLRRIDPARYAPCDFVIAHGLYSWVPDDARDAIMTFCRDSLTPMGLAYVSYNAQPGWATRRIVREILLGTHAVREATLEDKAGVASAAAGRLLEQLPSGGYAWSVLLAEELQRVRDGESSYVLHEYLAETNDGFWLRDFVDHAQRHGLDYVADAQFCRMEGHVPFGLSAATTPERAGQVEREQIVDLLGHRYFHSSILCRAGARDRVVPTTPDLCAGYLATALRAVADPFVLTDGAAERFAGIGGVEIVLDAAITKAAVVTLAVQWPRGQQLEALYHEAALLLSKHQCPIGADARHRLTNELTRLFEIGQIDLRMAEPPPTSVLDEYPEAHALARYEAEHRTAVTTPYHTELALEPDLLALVRSLDGSRSRTTLKRAFGAASVDRALPLLSRWGLLACRRQPSSASVRRPGGPVSHDRST